MENYLNNLLSKVFSELNDFIADYNAGIAKEGGVRFEKQILKIVGQTALFLAKLPFSITATNDLDLITAPPYAIQNKLQDLLKKTGIGLDPDGRLIWMPENTVYHMFFDSRWVQACYADPESVLLSKYKFKRPDDQKLIQTYLQYFPGFQKLLDRSKPKGK